MKSANQHIKSKKILAIIVLLILFLPMFQQLTQLFPKDKLRGSFQLAKKVDLTKDKWFNTTYQTESESYLNDHLGFRPFFIRTYNQIHFSFYNQAKANGVIVGKDNYLYEENYIKAHLGLDYIGEKAIKDKVFKIKKIQDTLATKGIDLIVILAPGKASFYPEFIPDKYYKNATDSTNYKTYKKELKNNKINILDYNSWFIENKGKKVANLFPKTGIHWSMYGQVLVMDSLINYISKLKNVRLPQLIIDSLVFTTKMQGTDQDIENGMNLLGGITDLKMAYPQLAEIKNNKQSANLSVLAIGDSYYLGLQRCGVLQEVFKSNDFWFYNQQIYKNTQPSEEMVGDINMIKEVEKKDVIILCSTDANLYKFGFSFIDNLYDEYYTKLEDRKSYKKEKAILDLMNELKNSTYQNKLIKEKAHKNGNTFEEELRANAKFIIWDKNQKSINN